MNKYDLIVVGSSFASTFFLKKYLSKAPSEAKVLVLERGYLYPHAERVKAKKGEETPFGKINEDIKKTFINNTPEKSWNFQTGFGGSSNCWTGGTPRFLPNDFKMKSLYGVGADWPIQYEDLDSYYTEVEEYMSVSGPEITPFPKNSKYPQPPHLFTDPDKILHKTYGNLYINQPTVRARIATNSRNACCVSNVCEVCPVNAKFTIENSQLEVYEDKRINLVFGAQVIHLNLENDTVKGVVFLKDDKEQQAFGEVVALGANAIFNAHILLSSGDKTNLTGRGLGEQVGLQVTVSLKDIKNVGGSSHINANGYMLYDGAHRSEYAACLMESSNSPFIRMERGKWRNLVSFRMIFEDLPDNQNFVAISSDRLKPQLNYFGHTDYVSKGIERMKRKLPQILSCLPVEEIIYKEPFGTESHILGTTRMSDHPEEGVVDKHLIHHQYRNLFVLGSGSFTTFTPANPTLTLSALSLFAADKSF